MQHVEFFHKDHFENRYRRRKAKGSLSQFIDFFWETDFDELFVQYPDGFSDALFPNVGYTYLINLGTPCVMQLEDEKYDIKNDGFLPRHKAMICHHSTGNKLFGIKFNVSPVVFQKRVNFSEYREYIFPLAYLIDRAVVDKVRKAGSFEERVKILSDYYEAIIAENEGSLKPVAVVTEILQDCATKNSFDVSIEELSKRYGISTRTLQRYFETSTGITSKKALQILRIRKAVEALTKHPGDFHYNQFGYYDYSHFLKHLKQFLTHQTVTVLQPHLKLLKG
ncbi:helix-turn-helix domain-containing protein [Flavisolibacter ginsenosidimutans]|uniref:AraC family transcriptional regulator n=1 Tax=Flavisolibacter ginsenosidimutans TaxID=661481 RepID=A0A5B8UK82_9BACT|nr:helix-turn-helix domain-containing protein [Flavisolibacter ginsenosidimutans]QEC56973.1 AraC family transcriptional regulator [Flavisolibacter ginsenosidimutans]